MIQARCPTCAKPFSTPSLDQAPWFPFCSERCRLIDLGRWLDGEHAIPGPPAEVNPSPETNGANEHDED